MKITRYHYLTGERIYEVDRDAGTITRWWDGVVTESRPLTDAELDEIALPETPGQVRSLNDAVDQLILDALMGA